MKNETKTLEEIFQNYLRNQHLIKLSRKIIEKTPSSKELPEVGYINQYFVNMKSKTKIVGEYNV
jgi:hypothetical protein